MRSLRKPSGATERNYHFRVYVGFEMQFTFAEKEVEESPEGGEGDVEPTVEALAALEHEIGEYLSQQYGVDKVEAWAECDDLLGTADLIRPLKHSNKQQSRRGGTRRR